MAKDYHHKPPVEQEPEEGDPCPYPEDEEFFVRPDVAAMEEAIGKFLDGLGPGAQGFSGNAPIPRNSPGAYSTGMTHAEALEGKFLPDLDEEQMKRLTPSKLIMYRHAQDFRYIVLYTSISQ
jgi:hypothetical protein